MVESHYQLDNRISLVIEGRSLADIGSIVRQLADGVRTSTERQELVPRPWRAEEQDYFLGLGGYFPEEEQERRPLSEGKREPSSGGERLVIPDHDLYDKECPFGSE